MQKLLREYLDELNKKRKKNMRAGIAMLLLAVMVIGCVAGSLSQYGVAMTGNEKCGKEAHQHSAECYKNVLICGREEDPGHIHSDECRSTEQVLTCGMEEGEEHTHTEACYTTEEVYVCGEEEREAHFHSEACYEAQLTCEKEEHIHTDVCYMDTEADVETEEVWARQYADIEWKGVWSEDLVTAAQKQLGYQESIKNFTVAEDGSHKGYTRYGAFAGNLYVDWDAAFVNFCLYYAGIKNNEVPFFTNELDSAKWCEEFGKVREGNAACLTGPEGYVPAAGDLVFFNRENEETAVQMGIVASFDQEKNELHVIEGNSQNEVKENIYAVNDEHIVTYLKMAEAEAAYKEAAGTGALEASDPQEGAEAPAETESGQTFFTTGDQEESEAPEERTVELTTEVDGTKITLSGPESSFEAGKEYSIQAEKIEDKEMLATIEEAIAPLEDPNAEPIATAAAAEEPAAAPEGSGAAEDSAPAEETTAASEETTAPAEDSAAASEETMGAAEEQVPLAEEIPTAAEDPAALANETPAETGDPAAQAGDIPAEAEEPTAAAEESESAKTIRSYQAFDIKLMADGEEVQPLGPVSVKFSSQEVVSSVEDDATEVKVIHVDENTGAATDMEAAATEEKDVVIETNHFSVYVYVEVTEDPIGGVKIDIQHWARGLNIVDSTHIEYTGNVKEEAFDLANHQVKKKENVSCQLYTTDKEFRLPNETYMDVADLSKVCNVGKNKVARYQITEVWVSNGTRSSQYSESAQSWTGAYTKYEADKLTGEEIKAVISNLEDGSVIRFWYEPTTLASQKEPVTFYDYDISIGLANGTLNTKKNGINADNNYSNNQKPKLGVGQSSSGNASEWVNNTYDGKYLNAGNSNQSFEGLVEKELIDNKIVFNSAIDVPSNLFAAKTGKEGETNGSTRYDDYQLEFSQEGDTYTLESVWKGDQQTGAKDLTKFIVRDGYGNRKINTNEFWPLDGAEYAKDPLMGKTKYKINPAAISISAAKVTEIGKGTGYGENDFPENDHNWYFGMVYEVEFTVGDYSGPLEYYFRGDDDFWLFLDGELVVDLGGIHAALGKTYDVRTEYLEKMSVKKQEAWLKEPHTLKVYYMERGATGSTCYMQFTLPRAQIVPVEEPETTSYTVNKIWNDNENAFRPDIKISLYKEKTDGSKVLARTITLPLRDKNNPDIYVDQEGNPSDVPIWSYTWNNLPKYDGMTGERIKYSVEEEYLNANPMLGYTVGYVVNDDRTVATVTNTLTDKKIKVRKIWEGDESETGNRPGSVTFVLYANGEKYVDQKGNGRTVTLSAPDWEGEFHHVPEYYYNKATEKWELVKYTVVELSASGQTGEPALDSDGNLAEGEGSEGEEMSDGGTGSIGEDMSDDGIGSVDGETSDGEIGFVDGEMSDDEAGSVDTGLSNEASGTGTARASELQNGEFLGKNGAIYGIEIKDVTTKEDKDKGYIACFKATNTLRTKNVCIEKVSKSQPDIHLKGAEFTLYKFDREGTQVVGITDPVKEVGVYTTEDNGRIDIKGLRFGEYYLKETKAPDGYFILEKPIKVVVGKKGVTCVFPMDDWDNGKHVTLESESKYVIQAPNELAYVLPSTGGLGIYWCMLSGILLMAAASLIVYRNKRKEVL